MKIKTLVLVFAFEIALNFGYGMASGEIVLNAQENEINADMVNQDSFSFF